MRLKVAFFQPGCVPGPAAWPRLERHLLLTRTVPRMYASRRMRSGLGEVNLIFQANAPDSGRMRRRFLVVEHRARRRRLIWKRRCSDHAVASNIPSCDLHVRDIYRRLARSWPDQGEVLAKVEAAGYSQIREMTAGKIMTYKAVRAGKEVSLVVDSFGKIKELP